MAEMFQAIAIIVFVAFLVWVRRRTKTANWQARHLEMQLAETQRGLEGGQQRLQQLAGVLSEMHQYRVSPIGRMSKQELADFAVKTVSPLLGVGGAVLLLLDRDSAEFRAVAGRGVSPQQLAELRIRPGEGILGGVARKGEVKVANAAVEASVPQEKFLTAPYIVLPLRVNTKIEGLLALCNPHEGNFGLDAVRVASLAAKQIELTLENLALYADRQRVYHEVVTLLTQALGLKDPGSFKHGERCRMLVRGLAQELHLPELLIEQIEYGAQLHDVGKLAVDETILQKPEALSDEDRIEVKQHPQLGYDLLRRVRFFSAVAPIVLHHHEWYNGQGYPEGLAGEEIPLGARIVSIADAWQKMTSDQPYRKALPKSNAIAELRQQAGTQFDPQLVDTFLRIIDKLERDGDKAAEAPAAAAAARPNG